MGSKRNNAAGGVPWSAVVPLVHAIVDLATNARCPDFGNQVVSYICLACKKPVWPERGQAAA